MLGGTVRKIRPRTASLEGAKMFSNIMTRTLTRRRRSLNVLDVLLKILNGA